MSLFMGLILASCNDDDDYTIINTPILTEDSVVTGSADVTATTAILHGTVDGIQNSSASSYTLGFRYGFSENSLTETVSAVLDGSALTGELTGLTENTVLYYQAFVTLQGKVTFSGDVKSLVTTNTVVSTVAPLPSPPRVQLLAVAQAVLLPMLFSVSSSQQFLTRRLSVPVLSFPPRRILLLS